MPTLPTDYLNIVAQFASLFSKCLWAQVQVLVVGAILTPGPRTVTAVLRIMGLSHERHFQTYHRVLNRAVWSCWEVSRVLLQILVGTFAASGPVIIGIDDTIERRWGATHRPTLAIGQGHGQIKARGIYRDPVRSSHSHTVKASGLRWLSLMLLVPIPWAKRVWALPFLTVLAPSERYYQGRKRAHKKLTAWAQQALLQVRRWLPTRDLVIVADSSFAVITLLARLRRLSNPVCMITRFRLDAGLYEPVPARKVHQQGRPRVKGQRLPTLEAIAQQRQTRWKRVTISDWYGEGAREIELVSKTAVWYHCGQPPVPIRWVCPCPQPSAEVGRCVIRDPKGKFKTQALLCTDLTIQPTQIVTWFVLRWQLEVTFREVRAHLGVETQRQWSDRAIARTTPALLGLFSLVTVLAHQRACRNQLPMRQTAWYIKPRPTFSDALAVVRRSLWHHVDFSLLQFATDTEKLTPKLLERFMEALCYAG